jgi:hypothetical protein
MAMTVTSILTYSPLVFEVSWATLALRLPSSAKRTEGLRSWFSAIWSLRSAIVAVDVLVSCGVNNTVGLGRNGREDKVSGGGGIGLL